MGQKHNVELLHCTSSKASSKASSKCGDKEVVSGSHDLGFSGRPHQWISELGPTMLRFVTSQQQPDWQLDPHVRQVSARDNRSGSSSVVFPYNVKVARLLASFLALNLQDAACSNGL